MRDESTNDVYPEWMLGEMSEAFCKFFHRATKKMLDETGILFAVSKEGHAVIEVLVGVDGCFGGQYDLNFDLEKFCKRRPPWQHGSTKAECLAIAQSLRRLAARFEKGATEAEYE